MNLSAAHEDSTASFLHQNLIDKMKREGRIQSSRIEAAFRAVPRHLFLPGVAQNEVYKDDVIFTKQLGGLSVSASSQPSVMAMMLEQLDLEPGHRVLEIGAGTGYNAALMAYLVGDAGQVTTVDLDEDLVQQAREHLAAAGFERVHVVCGDGGFGYSDGGPYDRIILAVGAWDIAPAWRDQLKCDGRLLLPLSIRGVHKSVAFEHAHDHLVSVSVKDCRFVMLRGAFAEPEAPIQLEPEVGLHLSVDHQTASAETAYQLLTNAYTDWPVGVQLTAREFWGGLRLWLALHEPHFCILSAEGAVADKGILPDLYRLPGKFSSTAGLLGEKSMCVLMRSPERIPSVEQPNDSPPFRLWVRSFGSDNALTHRLIDQIIAWDSAGRPANDGLRLRAYPQQVEYTPSANEFMLPKRWFRIVLDWL